ncbi:MAG: glycosyltransferase family 4 protein [Candidatus Thiodiazotropha sp.]|jgi:glycosyltransferase involved in cell wall biosynthesis
MSLKNVIIAYDFAYINGGQAKVAIDSARLLAEHGINVVYFAACGPADKILDHPRIKTVCLDQHDILSDPNRARAVIQGIWNGEAARALSDLTEQFNPHDTVLHCHGFAKGLSASIGPILTHGRLPSVYTMHEYFLACPNGGFYDYKSNEICTRKALSLDCLLTNCDVRHAIHKAWRSLRQIVICTFGKMPESLKDIIYISETQHKALIAYLSDKTNLHFVPNPIQLSEQSAVTANSNDIFLFIGRLNPEKGGVFFAKAARQAGVKAVFVGDGADRQAIVNENPEALITGWQTPEQVQQWISKARCLVFPSLWYECMPLVPFEVLARGVPIIVGAWSAGAEPVKHKENGLIFQHQTVESLKSAIEELKDDKHSVFKNVRHSMKETPGLDQHLNRLLDVYSKILIGHTIDTSSSSATEQRSARL